ncbi:hypothetical protein U9M48_020812 [Paspalum notatum var. saurae]|uniref:Uncharacterized protein n=1 Tax=Paspalum notatum var. saurae TaxID=547442 RepID=A0AAQ3THS5_PASNO
MAASMNMPNGGAAASTPSSTMKLLIDTASEHVLFAEAGKDVVDFILGLLAMPLGAVWHLLRDGDAADALGSIANIYASVEKMDPAHMQSAEARDALVVNDTSPASPSLRLLPATTTAPAFAHMPPPACPWHPPPMAGIPMAPLHPNPIHLPPPPPPPLPPVPLQPCARDGGGGIALLPPPMYRCHACLALGSLQSSEGFVQGVANYTVTDDLTVTPASNLSTVALLGRLGVKDLAALEERTVTVGHKECLEILKVSLRSKTVLTDVFVGKTNKRARTAGGDEDDD